MSTRTNNPIGVVLMTYGSATMAENVREYFEHIYPGKVSPELVADFEERYRLVGGSPLIEITKKQAALVEQALGADYIVRAGMRHSVPFINDAVAECKARGASSIVGIILSPQFSSFIMEGYRSALLAAARKNGIGNVAIAPAWPAEEHFIELLAKRTHDALSNIKKKFGVDAPVIFTTHSLPQRVVENDPHYLEELHATIDAVRQRLDPATEWYAGYQSAGHTPEAWLKPDLVDILSKLRDEKKHSVLIVPIQFLADHLEILYDLDIAAKAQCEEFGIAYRRIELPNTDPLFIEALASIARSK